MSKMITAVHRRPVPAARLRERARQVLEAIAPEAAAPDPTSPGPADRIEVRAEAGHVTAILGRPALFPWQGLALCQGKLFDSHARWWQPGSGHPDGSYALVRSGPDCVEVLTDPAGGRTVWYYCDDELFVAANSQRAVTLYAGRFAANPAAVPWVLSTGTPGPWQSYNRHLALLPPASTLRLERDPWRLATVVPEIRFAPLPRSRAEHRAAIAEAVRAVLAGFDDADAAAAAISLSGGLDSRLIAATLRALGPERRWRSFTGGAAGDLAVASSDAAIAAAVAARLGLEHRFVAPPPPPEPPTAVLDRFVLAGEGRVDHLAGYLDGMALLAELRARGEVIAIRGDEGMGAKPVEGRVALVRERVGLFLCGEIASLAPRLEAFGLAGHTLPPALARAPGESLDTWRDRLYHAFRLTHILGALNELKAAYVDVVNPLLSARLLGLARALPDELRTGKALFREVVAAAGPDLPVALNRRTEAREMYDFLLQPAVRAHLVASLRSPTGRRLFAPALVDWLATEVERRMTLAYRLRHGLARRLRPGPAAGGARHGVDPVRLAFRAHMAVTMVERLEADARLLAPPAALAAA